MKKILAILLLLVLLVSCAPLEEGDATETEDKEDVKTQDTETKGTEDKSEKETEEKETKETEESKESEKTENTKETEKINEKEETESLNQAVSQEEVDLKVPVMEERLIKRNPDFKSEFGILNDKFYPQKRTVPNGYVELSFINKDNYEHKLRLMHEYGQYIVDEILTVPANGKESIKIDLKYGEAKIFDVQTGKRVQGGELILVLKDKKYIDREKEQYEKMSYIEAEGVAKKMVEHKEDFEFIRNYFEDLELIETIPESSEESILKNGNEEIWQSKKGRRQFTRHVGFDVLLNTDYVNIV